MSTSQQNTYVVAEIQWKGLMFKYMGPKSWLYHLPAVWSWTNQLIFLSEQCKYSCYTIVDLRMFMETLYSIPSALKSSVLLVF